MTVHPTAQPPEDDPSPLTPHDADPNTAADPNHQANPNQQTDLDDLTDPTDYSDLDGPGEPRPSAAPPADTWGTVPPAKRHPLRTIFVGIVGLILLLGVVAGGIYASDAPVDATVTEHSCATPLLGGTSSITVRTVLFGFEHTLTDIPPDQCLLVKDDAFVRYRVRSERTSIWESQGGACIWDTIHGLNGCDR